MDRFDVVVVGGGPAGSVTARIAAAAGARVLLLEERKTIEEPSACAGLVSPRTLAVLGASEACVVRRPRDLAIRAPDGTTLALTTSGERALVVDRSILEMELLARARAAGADVRLGARAIAWHEGVVGVAGPRGDGAAKGSILVGADGPESQVAAWVGLPRTRSLDALQVEIEGPDDGVVRVFVGRDIAPGFFAWSVPAQPGRLRVGLAVTGDLSPAPYLDRLLATRFPSHRVVAKVRGRIPVPRTGPVATDDTVLVGDAAGHVKPLSGGGLYFGGLCARLAGRSAARAAASAARGATASKADELQRYERQAEGILGPETRFGEVARAVRDALDDDDWRKILQLLGRRDLLAIAAETADLDHLRHMARRLLAHPRVWPSLVALWSIIGDRIPPGITLSGIARSEDEFL